MKENTLPTALRGVFAALRFATVLQAHRRIDNMTLLISKRMFVFAAIVAICSLFPAEAKADAINFGFVAVAGIIILAPLTLFAVFVEGIFLSIGLRIPYRRTLLILLAANLASLAAGIPVKGFNEWMYSQILPRPLAPYFRLYPLAVILGTAIFFLVTLVVEYFVIAAWCRKRTISVRSRRIAVFILIANVITYSVLAPLHYFATRPTHDVREFTDDSAWAQRPVTEIYYIGDSGNLCSIMTDGQNNQVVVPDDVRDYQYLPAQATFLYRNATNDLSLFRRSEGKPIVCWQTDQRFMMEQVACGPGGQIVCYLSRVGELKPYELILFESNSGRVVRTGIVTDKDDYNPEVAWSNDPATLFLKSGRAVQTVSISDDLKAIVTEHSVSNRPLSIVYGRFSGGHWWGGGDWGASLSHDKTDSIEAYAMPGLGSHLQITKDNTPLVVADNPGLLKLGNRDFNDVCILSNGIEIVFDDYQDIYLLSVDNRKVGRIVQGSKFITLSSRYQRNIWDANK